MRLFLPACTLLVAACRAQAPETGDTGEANGSLPDRNEAPRASRWALQSAGEGTALALLDTSGSTVLRLFCASGTKRLLVNVPAFKPIGSEERLSFGGGGDVVALVADTRGDPLRGGVSGVGEAPPNLGALLSAPLSASYGAQTSGPHGPPSADDATALVKACIADSPGSAVTPPAQPAHPCNAQDDKPLPAIRLRAIGTEPFWGARIEGRCVTYSHPDDQSGTRVWTRFSGSAAQGSWSGSLGGQPFVLGTRPQPGCSDGMSDRTYPIAVTLTVSGEQRRGCAEPL